MINIMSAQMAEPQADEFDVFPLKSNLHYTYNYYTDSLYYELAYLHQLKVDSGFVEYIVHDSLMTNDSTVVWNLEERRYLWHRRFDINFGLDSIYWTNDTVFLSLFENIYENHELSSSGIIWDFPIILPSQAIYRFIDSSLLILICHWDENGRDTLQFSNNLGFFYRHRTWSWDYISHLYTNLRIELQGIPSDIRQQQSTLPSNSHLSQNYPNPFNPLTQLTYSIPKATNVTLKVYDMLGREITTLVNERKEVGEYKVSWNVEGVPSGVYFYRIVAGEFVETKKMVVVR
jgi:hypothetical protein